LQKMTREHEGHAAGFWAMNLVFKMKILLSSLVR
jgi:hypothetical protein